MAEHKSRASRVTISPSATRPGRPVFGGRIWPIRMANRFSFSITGTRLASWSAYLTARGWRFLPMAAFRTSSARFSSVRKRSEQQWRASYRPQLRTQRKLPDSSGSSQCLLFRTIARRYAGWPGGTFDEVGSSRAAVDGGPPRRFRGRSSPHLLLRSLSCSPRSAGRTRSSCSMSVCDLG
jgi:hypothetical protein